MRESVRQRLLSINHEFYEQFGASFSGTRFGAQPGWDRIIHYFPKRGAVLDLGCGNGRLALYLEGRLEQVRYVGLEGSAMLLAIARKQTENLKHISTEFFQVDLSTSEWHRESHHFDVVTALAVLHHIPGFEQRKRFIRAASGCLKPGGVLILSNWRFMQNPRMRRKLLPWAAAGLSQDDVEPGDFLLDWKKDGEGMRYAHQIDETEIKMLAESANLTIAEQFVADGRDRDLSLYSVLQTRTI